MVSISGSLNIGASSLRAQQQAMDVVAQNIANANTPGYSRQETILVSEQPQQVGILNLGRGVKVGNIRRVVDAILTRAQLANSNQNALAQTIQQGLASVQSTFGALGTPGLTSALDAFFASLQAFANTPADAIVRANVLSKAQSLVTQVTDMRQQLSDRRLAADQEIDPLLTKANTLLTQIADLNGRIVRAEAGRTAFQANDLRDQRDARITDLSKLIGVHPVVTNDGGLLLQTPGGDMLVQGATARQLKITAGGSGFNQIVFTDNNLPASGLTQGGQIGGLITLRDDRLTNYIKQLDSLAANLAFGINRQHVNGTGTSIVSSYTSAQTAADSSGAATAVNLDANVSFASKIKTGAFNIYVLNANGTAVNTPPGSAITVTSGTTKLADIAAAINLVNGVSASVSNGKLTINGGANRIVLGGDTSNFLAAYEINAFFHSGATAADFSVNSAIAADAGRIASGVATSPNPPDPSRPLVAASDNTAALGLLGLRDQAISIDGTAAASPITRAATLVSTFGLDVAAANQQASFRAAEANALSSQRQSKSGVNVDTELVNMIRFQRAYEASAKLIQVSNRMLDSLLSLVQ